MKDRGTGIFQELSLPTPYGCIFSGSSRPSSAGSCSSKEEGKTTPSLRLTTETVKVRKRNMDTSGVPACPFFGISS